MEKRLAKGLLLISLILLNINTIAQDLRMWGTIVNSKGQPVAGAMLEVENTNIMTLTTSEGEYLLQGQKKHRGYKVIISAAGFRADTITFSPYQHDHELRTKESVRFKSLMLNSQHGSAINELDVPIAISFIDSERQKDFNFTQINEISNTVPGFLSLAPSSDWGIFGIRGVATEGIYAFERSRISIYKDGISLTEPRCNVLELFDMDHVEVYKGPQSTVLGKGGEFGVVHYVTNKPKKEFEMMAGGGYGNYNQRNGDFMINNPLGDKLANRLALHYDYHDGYMTNKTGGTLNGKNAMAAKEAISYFPNERMSHTLTLNYERDAEPAIGYKSGDIAPQGGSTSPFTYAQLSNEGMGQNIRRNIYSAEISSDISINELLHFSNSASYMGFDSKNGYDLDGSYLNVINTRYHTWGKSISDMAQMDWHNKRGRLSGTVGIRLAYDERQVSSRHYGNFHTAAGIVIGPKMKEQLTTLPTQAAMVMMEIIKAQGEMLKASLDEQTGKVVDATIQSIYASITSNIIQKTDAKMNDWFESKTWSQTPDFYGDLGRIIRQSVTEEVEKLLQNNPEMAPIVGMLTNGQPLEKYMDAVGPTMAEHMAPIVEMSNVPFNEFFQENEQHFRKSWQGDIFADLKWKIYKELYLTMGLRGSYEKQNVGYSSTSDVLPLLGHAMFHSSDGKLMKTSENYISWAANATLNCKVDSTHNLFVSISKGCSPGDIHFDNHPEKIVNLKPEEIINYEIGFKGKSKYSRFYYYIAAYYYDWLNFQSQAIGQNADASMQSVQTANGKAYGTGFDGQLEYTFTDSISAYIHASLCNGEVTEKDTKGNPQIFAGKKFIMMPKGTFDAGLNWQYPLGPRQLLSFHPMASYISKMFFTNDNDSKMSQNGFWLINANLGYAWKTRGNDKTTYEVSIYGKNLLNTQYLVSAGNGGSWLGLPTYVAGPPLTAGIVFRVFWK